MLKYGNITVVMIRKNKKSIKRFFRNPTVMIAIILIAGIVIGVVIIASRHNPDSKTSGQSSGTTKVTTIPSVENSGKSIESKGSSASTPSTESVANQTIPVSALITPYGTFVSNHYPSLSGSSAPSQEESTCTTTPGASCYIQFTKNDAVKKLATQITDDTGMTSWTWDVKKSGFTIGDWKITAVASSGNNSKSRQDTILLSISR